jgi:hypothetical protein
VKILGIFFLVYLLNLGFIYIVDRLAGLKFSQSLSNMTAPFSVIEFPEYVIVIVALSLVFVPPIFSFYKQRK